jgi:hypothetical protein
MQYRPVLLLLSLLLLKSVGCSKHTKLLKPFDYITGELIDLDGDAKAYQLTQLKPSTGYEVRLSFPASVSTCNSQATSNNASVQRILLQLLQIRCCANKWVGQRCQPARAAPRGFLCSCVITNTPVCGSALVASQHIMWLPSNMTENAFDACRSLLLSSTRLWTAQQQQQHCAGSLQGEALRRQLAKQTNLIGIQTVVQHPLPQ